LNGAIRAARNSRSASGLRSRPVLRQVDRGGNLAEALVGQAEHARLGHVGMRVDLAFDLDRRDVLAAADDDVLLAVDDVEVSVLVKVAEVARAEPAIGGERLAGRSSLFQ
jgi:hypothetical protein